MKMKNTLKSVRTIAATLITFGSLAGGANAALTANLVVNGDAETGDLSGWTTVNGMEKFDDPSAIVRGMAGLVPPDSVGDHSFAGLTGPSFSSALQSIDLSPFNADISVGTQAYTVGALLQNRSDTENADTATAIFTFLDGESLALGSSVVFTDLTTDNPSLWSTYSNTGLIPATAQTLEVEIRSERTGGVSADAYVDNVHFALIPEPSSALLVGLGALLVAAPRRARSC